MGQTAGRHLLSSTTPPPPLPSPSAPKISTYTHTRKYTCLADPTWWWNVQDESGSKHSSASDADGGLSDEEAYQAAADADDGELSSDGDGDAFVERPTPLVSKKAAKRAKAAARAEAEAEAAAVAQAEAKAAKKSARSMQEELQTYQNEEERLVRAA